MLPLWTAARLSGSMFGPRGPLFVVVLQRKTKRKTEIHCGSLKNKNHTQVESCNPLQHPLAQKSPPHSACSSAPVPRTDPIRNLTDVHL